MTGRMIAPDGPSRALPRSFPGQRCLVGPDGGGEADDQGVGGQLVADRGFGQRRHGRDQGGQIVEVEVVPGIDDEPERGGARGRRRTGLQCGGGVAGATRGGIVPGIDLDAVGAGARQPTHLNPATAGLTNGVSRLSSFQPSSEVSTPGPSGTSVTCSGRTARTISNSRSSG